MRSGAAWAIQTAMKRSFGHSVASALALLAVVLQVLLPGTLAFAEPSGFDASRLICVSSGQMSADAKAALEEIAELLGEDVPDRQPYNGHCPFCTLVHAMHLPEPVTLAAPAEQASVTDPVRYQPGGFARKAQGPPLGSRGPPARL